MIRRIGGLLAVSMVFAAGREDRSLAATAPCSPAALVHGDPDMVVATAALLEKRGVAVAAETGCPAVRAHVEHVAAGVRVTIEDVYGRRSERVVFDAGGAATVIESWTRTDVSGPLLAPRSTAEPAVATEVAVPAQPAVVRTLPPAIGVSVGALTSVATDGSIWVGLDLSACVRIGRICAGMVGRANADTDIAGSSEHLETSRVGVDLLLSVDVPVQWGKVLVTPGAGVGVGWLRSGSAVVESSGENIDVDGGGLRANAHVHLLVPVGHEFALDFGLSADVSPLAHTTSYLQDGAELAGEPRGYLRGGVGLRYGAP